MKITQVMMGAKGGGVERIAPDMSLSLAEAGHQVQLIINSKFQLPENHRHKNLTVLKVNVRNRRDIFARWKIHRALKNFDPDVAHLHLRQGVTLTNRLCQRLRIPTLTSMHNYGNPNAYDRVDKILVPTQSLHRFLTEHHIPERKLALIPNFSRMSVAPVAGSLPKSPHFFSFGRFVEKKGFDGLIKAVGIAKNRGYYLRLALAGEGPEKQKLDALVQQNGLSDRVRLVSWQTDVKAFIDAHDVFVLPSLDEPFGLVLLEASARGKPVITSTTEGPKEILDESSAFWFDVGKAEQLADKMIDVIERPTDALVKAERAQQVYTAKYSHQQFASDITKVYQQTMAEF